MRQTKSWAIITCIFLCLFILLTDVVQAEWVFDDEGNMFWWDPPIIIDSPNDLSEPIPESQNFDKQTLEAISQINAEIIFAMDTSGSMYDEFSTLCARIQDIVSGIEDSGITLTYKILGINSNYRCTTNTVRNLVVSNGGIATVNHVEDWGPAIVDLSKYYPWESNHVRIVIPMSDESAENGGGSWGSDDEAAANSAISAAVDNSVLIVPVLCSGYNSGMLNAAQNMAQSTHGRYFTSLQPDHDLIDGIVSAIKDAVGSIEISGIYPYAYIDDAYLAPESTVVYKLAGDIVQLVCQINNNSDKEVVAKLYFNFPDNWELVNDSVSFAVKKRYGIEDIEDNVDINDISYDKNEGKISINNIKVPAKVNSETGRSFDYVVKLIIPTNDAINYCPDISFNVEWDDINDPNDNKFESSEKKLNTVSITNNLNRFILTNRYLLYETYGTGLGNSSVENDSISKLIGDIHKLASQEGAYVFYIDEWDLYDNFTSEMNPDCSLVDDNDYCTDDAPIKYWDREAYFECGYNGGNYQCNQHANMNSQELNRVANRIDSYVHYWASKTGGLNSEHWLMILGDDQIIPYGRKDDPTGNASSKYTAWYGQTPYLESLAQSDLILSDIVYQDTDGSGKVDLMYAGRIVGRTATTLQKYIANLIDFQKEFSDQPFGNTATITSGKGHSCNEDNLFRKQIIDAEKTLSSVGYSTVWSDDQNCSSDTCKNDCKDGDWSIGCLLGSDHLWDIVPPPWDWTLCTPSSSWDIFDINFSYLFEYEGHGHPSRTSNFSATELALLNPDIKNSSIFLFGCGLGMFDRFPNLNPEFMTGEFFDQEIKTLVGSTSVSVTGYNGSLLKKLNENFSDKQLSIGAAFNKSKKDIFHLVGDKYDLSSYGYTLYGCPWIIINNPQVAQASSLVVKDTLLSVQSSSDENIISSLDFSQDRLKSENVINLAEESYDLIDKNPYQFIEIEGFTQYHHDKMLVLPNKQIEVDLPKECNITSVKILATNQVIFNNVTIPVFNDYPPIVGAEPEPIYVESTDLYGFFDPISNPIWYTSSNINYTSVFVDLIPVTYDADSKTAVLYKDLIISIEYETENKGLLLSTSTTKILYNTGDTLTGSATIENTCTEGAWFDVNGKIVDVFGNEILNTSISLYVEEGGIESSILSFGNIYTPGTYFMIIDAYDSSGKIGNDSIQFSVSSGNIIDFNLPEILSPGETVNFAVSFFNSSDQTLEPTIKMIFYQYSNYLGETVPIVIEVESMTTGTANFTWVVPEDFWGDYVAVAVASYQDGSDSKDKKFSITSYNQPIANAGSEQIVEVGAGCIGYTTLDGSASSDPNGDPLSYFWTWDGGTAIGVSPTVELPLGATIITLVVNNGTADSEPDTVMVTVEDTSLPELEIGFPIPGSALQDGVTFSATASDSCGIASLSYSIRELGGNEGVPIGYENFPAVSDTSGRWVYSFDTVLLQDGYYVLMAKTIDENGNEGKSELVPFSIRNWAILQLLPASDRYNAGRTMPIKFSLRIAESVDSSQPFVYNENLEIKILNKLSPESPLQISSYGEAASDYRIEGESELYITNFKTAKTPAQYSVEIWRKNKNFLIGSFDFVTTRK